MQTFQYHAVSVDKPSIITNTDFPVSCSISDTCSVSCNISAVVVSGMQGVQDPQREQSQDIHLDRHHQTCLLIKALPAGEKEGWHALSTVAYRYNDQDSTSMRVRPHEFTFFVSASRRQYSIIRPHGGHYQHLVAHIFHHCGQELPADAVKVMQVFQHDGQGAIGRHKLLQHLFLHPTIVSALMVEDHVSSRLYWLSVRLQCIHVVRQDRQEGDKGFCISKLLMPLTLWCSTPCDFVFLL